MARRKDAVLGGRWLAGEHGDLFVNTDGHRPVFDWEADEVHPSPEFAAAAWERVRTRTWKHPDREVPWPPAGAVHDGIVSRTERCGWKASAAELQEAVVADLADVERFRSECPEAAEEIAVELDAYTSACELLAGLAARPGDRMQQWERIQSIGVYSQGGK